MPQVRILSLGPQQKSRPFGRLFCCPRGILTSVILLLAGARARRFGGEPSSAAGGSRRTMVRAARSQNPAAIVYADGFCGNRGEAAKPRMPQVRILSLGPSPYLIIDTMVEYGDFILPLFHLKNI